MFSQAEIKKNCNSYVLLIGYHFKVSHSMEN